MKTNMNNLLDKPRLWIIITYVNFGIAVGTLLTYIGGKI